MASIVITALRDGDGPCPGSLGAAGLAREIADKLGATVYACLSLGLDDDLDDWVTALGSAGVDRIACARSDDSESASHADIHLELIRRLGPRLVLVPACDAGNAVADVIAAGLGSPMLSEPFEWREDSAFFGDEIVDGTSVILASVDLEPPSERGGQDIDVLFFDVDADAIGDTLDAELSPTP